MNAEHAHDAKPPSRRRRRESHTVVNMPPPWRRSLTESGMRRETSRADLVVVAVFLVVAVALVALLAAGL